MPRLAPNPAAPNTGELRIALTVDTDSDQFDPSVDAGKAPLPTWKGVKQGITAMIQATATCRDSLGNAPRFTWFVRLDSQIATLYHDCGYLLDEYADLWRQCRRRGDELAWHPHLYRREGTRWVQELDPQKLRTDLQETRESMRKRGFSPTSCRIGDAFGSNEVLQTLSELGLRCDATAMPGRVRRDQDRQLDWDGTPQHPYYPSRADYRRPGTPALNLLEIPMSMVAVKADYDAKSLLRYLDLSFHHSALREGLRSFLPQAQLAVTVSHPSAILPSANGAKHGLISHDLSEFCRNLNFLLEECERARRPARFVTIAEVEQLFSREELIVRQHRA